MKLLTPMARARPSSRRRSSAREPRLADGLSDIGLVAVDACRVDVAVAARKRVAHDPAGLGFRRRTEHAEAHLRNAESAS